MTPEEAELTIKDLFPEGKERWIKIKFLDWKKSRDVFKMNTWGADVEKNGYEVTAIAFSDDLTIQLQSLQNLKTSLDVEIQKIESQLIRE